MTARLLLVLGLLGPSLATAQVPTDPIPRREGFWFHLGAGGGPRSCGDCESAFGIGWGAALGGTLSRSLLLGVGTHGWVATAADAEMPNVVATVTALARFYPSAGGFHLLGGVGFGRTGQIAALSSEDPSDGLSILAGLGYDIRLGRNTSLTPFGNFLTAGGSGHTASVLQFGFGVTGH